jgi:hypothetical protein
MKKSLSFLLFAVLLCTSINAASKTISFSQRKLASNQNLALNFNTTSLEDNSDIEMRCGGQVHIAFLEADEDGNQLFLAWDDCGNYYFGILRSE